MFNNKNAFRNKCSLEAYKNQEKALHSRLLILRKAGPLSYILKEELKDRNFKINIGETHSCNCEEFFKTNDLCIHICWVLLRILKLSRDDPVSWQLGFCERQIKEVILNKDVSSVKNEIKSDKIVKTGKEVQRRPVNQDTECPVCLENIMSKHQPVTYCKYACGNVIHLSCMIQLAVHQKQSENGSTKCPICRSKFEELTLLKKQLNNINTAEHLAIQQNKHPGLICDLCNQFPIVGICYRCSKCENVFFCQQCFGNNQHVSHKLLQREKANNKWRPLENEVETSEIFSTTSNVLIEAHPESNDRKLLSQKVINLLRMFTVMKGSWLLQDGEQCCLCFNAFQERDCVRSLPCLHVFHKHCADQWLSKSSASCPIHRQFFSEQYIIKITNAMRNKIKAKKKKVPTATLR